MRDPFPAKPARPPGKASLVPDFLPSQILDLNQVKTKASERKGRDGPYRVSVGRPVPRRVVSFLLPLIDPRRVTERDFSPLKTRLQPPRSSLAFPCARCAITRENVGFENRGHKYLRDSVASVMKPSSSPRVWHMTYVPSCLSTALFHPICDRPTSACCMRE